MVDVCKELGEVKAELEKLKEEYQIKSQLSESLRRANSDQQSKCQEAKLKIEKQEKELNVKSEEIGELKQLYEEVKVKLQETEKSLKQVSSMNERLRIDSGEKVQMLEAEKSNLVSVLEEATTRNGDLEQNLITSSEEIKVLKARLSELQKKCSEVEEKVQVGKEMRHREDVFVKLEEESMSVQDQLKWKKEQFQHLEEAHRRLQDQFQLSKKEWESEKSAMFGEITVLQSKLDSHVRMTETLESRLKMCNQSLAHEESRRKLLEVQLSESKQCFENVLAEYEEAKEKIENLITKRDKDIAGLRNSLGTKEAVFKEMEYRVAHLEQDNKELLGTVKELQEAQINQRKVDPSVAKLRNKLKDLEKEHNKCFLTLEEKEAEWNSKMQKLIEAVKCHESDARQQNEQMNQLKTQLDHSQSAIEVSGEETSILFMVLKSEISNVYSKLFNLEAQTQSFGQKNGKNNPVSAENLENAGCLKQARAEIASLTQKLKSLELLEKRGKMLEDALEEHKNMLDESTQSQQCLKEQLTQMEVALTKVSNSLQESDKALTAKINEASQLQAELLLWKSKAESFRTCLEQSQEVCKKMETSILEQVEIEKSLRSDNEFSRCNLKEQEQIINDLQQKIVSLNQIMEQKEASIIEQVEIEKGLRKENEISRSNLKEQEQIINDLQQKIVSLSQILEQKETSIIELVEIEKGLRKDNEISRCNLKEQGQIINDLHQKIVSLNQILEQKEAMTNDTKLELANAIQNEGKLIHLLKERDAMVENFQAELEVADYAKQEALKNFECEKERVCSIIKEKNVAVEELRKEIEVLKQESTTTELKRGEAEKKYKYEKELSRVISGKDETIKSLNDLASRLENDFDDVFLCVLCKDFEGLVQMISLQEAFEKNRLSTTSEMEKKNKIIDVLETEVNDLHNKMNTNKLEMAKLTEEFGASQETLKMLVKELENKNETSMNKINILSSERENLLNYIDGVREQFGNLQKEGMELEEMLLNLMQNSGKDNNIKTHMSNAVTSSKYGRIRKEVEPVLFDRSPLRDRNQ